MAKKQTQQTLTTEQKSEAISFFTENVEHAERGAPKWAKIRAMASIAGQVIKELKGELAVLNRKVWIDKATAKLRAESNDPKAVLSLEAYEAIKKTANADFSRGMRDPNAKPAQTAQQQAGTSTQAATERSQDDGTGNDVPHVVQVTQALQRLSVRAKSIQAEMVQFQMNVRVPAAGKPLLGDMAEQIAKLVEEVGQAQAILA